MDIVMKELKLLLTPVVILGGLLYVIFAMLGHNGISIFLSIAFGTAYSLINFLMIGASITVSLTKPPAKAQVYMTVNYFIRYIISGSIIYYSIIIPTINPLTVIIPMFFPKIILVSRGLLGLKNH